MKYDFTSIMDRRGKDAIAGMGLAPLWVSDMIRGSVSEIITHLMN